MTDGHINGHSRDTYLDRATDPIARAKTDWDIMEYIADQLTELRHTFSDQPSKCRREYVKRTEARWFILVAVILIGKDVPWAKILAWF